jgi:hypothetical protein
MYVHLEYVFKEEQGIKNREAISSFLSVFLRHGANEAASVSEGVRGREVEEGRRRRRRYGQIASLLKKAKGGGGCVGEGVSCLGVSLMWMEMENLRVLLRHVLSPESARRGRGRGTAYIGHTYI